MQLCSFGCGQESLHQLKNGKWCCCKLCCQCPEIRKKNSKGVLKAHIEGRIPGWNNLEKLHPGFRSWAKGLTCETDERRKRNRDSKLSNIKLGKTVIKGHPHSNESKEKLSNAFHSKTGKCKYFKVLCPYENRIINVQGTYEYVYVLYLNKNNISWIRNRKLNLKYRIHADDYLHTYYPDFYLPNTDEYIEIKGYYWKSKDGRVDDERKMRLVTEQNPNKKITILMKEDLIKLGIQII